MELKEWNKLQISVFEKYGVLDNLELLQDVAEKISYLQKCDIDADNNMQFFEEIIKKSILSAVKTTIEAYQDLSELQELYSATCSQLPACKCTEDNFKSHLGSKIELYQEFGTELLYDVVVKIVKNIKCNA